MTLRVHTYTPLQTIITFWVQEFIIMLNLYRQKQN
jgi:hypothetical protein